MNQHLIDFLQSLGLSEKQAKIYLACLELGKSPISKIAKKAGLKRTSIYNVIDSLLEKGFLSKYEDEKGQKFLAESPEKLKSLLQTKEKELEELMPNFLAIANKGGSFKPEVKFYQGEDGLKAVYQDSLVNCDKGDEILSYASADDMLTFLPEYIPAYIKKRAAKGITMKAICPDTEITRENKKLDKKVLRNIKLTGKQELPVSIEKYVYKDKVTFMNFRGFLFGVIIKSPQIARSEKALFELLWKKLPD